MAEQVVFVVSDSGAVRQRAAGVVRHALGAHALPMRGGEAALAWAAVLRPAAVVVRVDCTGAGADLVRRLAAHPETRDAAIVGLAEDPDGCARALEAGCARAVALPLEPAELARAVGACVARAGRPGAAAVS